MFDGDVLAGPVPTLFADDPQAAQEALGRDPAKVKN
jgi:hypothetical protein